MFRGSQNPNIQLAAVSAVRRSTVYKQNPTKIENDGATVTYFRHMNGQLTSHAISADAEDQIPGHRSTNAGF